MAVLNFYAFQPSGSSANGTFSPDPVAVDSADDVIDAAELEGTGLEGGTIEGSADLILDGHALELFKITLDGQGYYADLGGTDLASLGQLKGAAEVLDAAADAFSEAAPVAVCFAKGTLIETDSGPMPVEGLAAGDYVITLDHGPRPIIWVGHHTASAKGPLRPIRISAGALGTSAPSADLIVSPHHRVVVKGWRAEVLFGQEEVLVTAESLVNDDTIQPVRDWVTVDYYHILFETHEIIISNGAHSESFNPSSIALDDCEEAVREEIYTLFPELRDNPKAFGKAARMVVTGKEARLIAE